MKISDMLPKDIFSQLDNHKKEPNSDMFADDFQTLDLEYYFHHSGEKTISSIYEKMNTTTLSFIILQKFEDKWNHIYEALKETYNPIHNYNMEETITRDLTNSSNGTNTNESSSTNNVNTNEKVYGFNSNEAVDSNQNNGNSNTSYSSNDSNTKNTTYKGTESTTRNGNIGVTTSQKMLKEELEVRMYLFYDMVMNDIDTILTLQIYE